MYKEEVQNWIKEIQQNRGKDPERLLRYCDKIEDYGRKVHDDALIGFACFSRGETYYLMNDVKNFYAQMLACLASMEEIGEWGYLAMANNMLGIMSLNRGNVLFAMDYYMKAINYCQTYRLQDLEWMIHMNIHTLYLNLGEYQKALDHLKIASNYIASNQNRPEYYQNLTSVYVGMAKIYLKTDELHKADGYKKKIENECMPHLDPLNRLSVDCFLARYYYAAGEEALLPEVIGRIGSGITKDIPIMDIFDDLCEYMDMLIEIGRLDDFRSVYEVMERLTEWTTVTNMRKKLLSMKIRYHDAKGEEEEKKDAALVFYELSEQMERENSLMVSNMIKLRSTLDDLALINQEVERENLALHRKSETDALTGLYNRFKLNEYGEEAFRRALEQQKGLGMEILDVDYFKQYNDHYGHQAGDAAICVVADAMAELQERSGIFCSRYGGDEFVIIYEGFNRQDVLRLAEELKDSICKKAIPHVHSKAAGVLTISQGICWGVPKAGDKVWDYLHTADQLLYQVKKVSRNSIRIGAIGEYMKQEKEV